MPDYDRRVTVPILWDKTETIVSNESSEIIRMFNSAFDGITGNTRFLARGPARPDRRRQRAHLFRHQQRRLQIRLRHHAGGL
jgi:glutathionyl-hydroquinone reductase